MKPARSCGCILCSPYWCVCVWGGGSLCRVRLYNCKKNWEKMKIMKKKAISRLGEAVELTLSATCSGANQPAH